MTFPRYPKYKPSGVEWLGEVPEHWEVKPIRKAARLESGHTPSRNHPEYWENCTVPWFSLADVWQIREERRDVIVETKEKVSELGLANSAARRLPAGTVMLSRTASVGFSAIMGVEMATTQDFANWVCGDELLPKFMLHVFRSMQGEFRRLMMGSTHNTIYMPDIQAFRFALPPLPEQRAIAAFLDRETAKIDGLVAEQQRLIELLKEKRQAVISHAVTKGLDPKAPMKPSGVEWLGDVPAHWEVKRLEHISEFVWGKAHEQFVDDAGRHVCVTARFVSTNGEATKFCTTNLTPARRGDILMVMSDLPNGRALARAFLVMDDRSYAINQRVCAVRLLQGEPTYFAMQLDRNRRLLAEDDGANQTHLSNHDFTKLTVLFPPPAEQERIGAAIGALRTRFDALAAEAESAITLLQERRSALISAAVTGQIDVRNAVAMEAV